MDCDMSLRFQQEQQNNCNRKELVELIRKPHAHDILSGRGSKINRHPGNKVFLAWVREQNHAYSLAQSRNEKASIIHGILDKVRSLDPPGRFLTRVDGGDYDEPSDGNHEFWIEMNEERVVAKASQALREGAPEIRASQADQLRDYSFLHPGRRKRKKPETATLASMRATLATGSLAVSPRGCSTLECTSDEKVLTPDNLPTWKKIACDPCHHMTFDDSSLPQNQGMRGEQYHVNVAEAVGHRCERHLGDSGHNCVQGPSPNGVSSDGENAEKRVLIRRNSVPSSSVLNTEAMEHQDRAAHPSISVNSTNRNRQLHSAAIDSWRALFPASPAVIGVIHVQPLPGTPAFYGNPEDTVSVAVAEAALYRDAGLDGIIVENTHDVPYLNGGRKIGPEITAWMTRIGRAVKEEAGERFPCGIQILSRANEEALATAHAAGMDFVRAGGFVNRQEIWTEPCAGELLRYRRRIGAERVMIFGDIGNSYEAYNVTANFDLVQAAKAAELFRADGVIVSGKALGEVASTKELGKRLGKDLVGETSRTDMNNVEGAEFFSLPVLVGSGVTVANCEKFIGAEGWIVGSAFKREGNWANEIDSHRVNKLMKKVKDIRSWDYS